MNFFNGFKLKIPHGLLFIIALFISANSWAAFPRCYNIGSMTMTVTDKGNGNATFSFTTNGIAATQYLAVYTPSGNVLRSSSGQVMQCALYGGGTSCSVNYQTDVPVNTIIMGALSLRANSDGQIVATKCTGQQNFTITPVPPATGCKISSPASLAVQWGNISASAINSRTTPEKVAAVTIDCGSNSFPIYTTLTNSNGDSSAINGLMKTSSGRIGISAKWNASGIAIPLGTKQSWPSLSGQRDFSIKYALTPLAVIGQESAGAFSTINTLSIEYR
ncbi:TPA: hypothetical protein ACSTL1_003967 [Serratia fonticola]